MVVRIEEMIEQAYAILMEMESATEVCPSCQGEKNCHTLDCALATWIHRYQEFRRGPQMNPTTEWINSLRESCATKPRVQLDPAERNHPDCCGTEPGSDPFGLMETQERLQREKQRREEEAAGSGSIQG